MSTDVIPPSLNSSAKVNFWKKTVSDPIRGLTLDRLTAQIDAFQNGYLTDFALTAEAMEQRDDILKNVITKRKKAVTRHGWEILTENCSPEARAQRDALDYFYRNLTCTHALRHDESGGFQLLIYQMMDALAKGRAVHEIIWKPQLQPPGRIGAPPETLPANHKSFENAERQTLNPEPPQAPPQSQIPDPKSPSFPNQKPDLLARSACLIGGNTLEAGLGSQTRNQKREARLTAEFRFVPLWYFEATTGKLRFLRNPYSLHGEEMRARDWLVTTGEALMIACSRAFYFKHAPLQSWYDYVQKFGIPGIRAVTSAARGTPEFEQMEETLQSFISELSVVTNTSESIDLIDLRGGGDGPFSNLVERMDRVMAALWRGADLSTLSRDKGYGATLQEQEARVLEQDDARSISEHLNSTIDRWVLEAMFGPNSPRLARLKILVSPEERTPQDLAIDEFLLRYGARLPLADTLERYGRVQAKPHEPALAAPHYNVGDEVTSLTSNWFPAPNFPGRIGAPPVHLGAPARNLS